MNITYIIGVILAAALMIVAMIVNIDLFAEAEKFVFAPTQIINFVDFTSIFITIGCTMAVVVASYPASMLKDIPKHFKVMLNAKKNDPAQYIDSLVELAQIARKNGLLSLEEKANEQTDPFFKQAIMLVVDANDQDKVRAVLENDIECMSARHDEAAGMYDKASSVAPAFGMIGTLVGLINMLRNMSLDGGGSNTIGKDMGVALITTLYGCILAHMIFGPIAANLRMRDSEEILCKQIIVEGVMAIQAGENPKALRERLLTYLTQKQREQLASGGSGGGGGGKAAEG